MSVLNISVTQYNREFPIGRLGKEYVLRRVKIESGSNFNSPPE